MSKRRFGWPGRSYNTNGTVDIGPMQVSQILAPYVATVRALERNWFRQPMLALRDNFCANVEAGAWILRQGLNEAHGDFWEGVGYYHSHDPEVQAPLPARSPDTDPGDFELVRLRARSSSAVGGSGAACRLALTASSGGSGSAMTPRDFAGPRAISGRRAMTRRVST